MKPSDPLSLRLLRWLPRNLLSRGFGRLARAERPRALPRALIRYWIRRFRVEIADAEHTPETYRSLVAFFTRRLKEGVRPIDTDPAVIVSPVDGAVGAFGAVEGDQLYQAKGMHYSLSALLGSEGEATAFDGGSFATLYLSPSDYHRIHAPCDGKVLRTLYEPGTLWPVNAPAVRSIPSLFAVNERITAWLETSLGPVALVMVGATNVGSIRLTYSDFSTNKRRRRKRSAIDHEPPIPVAKGSDLAAFELGSTVVLILPRGLALAHLVEGAPIRLGARLAKVVAPAGR